MMDRVELKKLAKQQIKGKIGILFLITLIIGLITGAASSILAFTGIGTLAVSIIITPAFTLSISRVYLGLAYGKEPQVADTFSGFDDFWSSFKVSFLSGLFTFLWSLLFVIPGIIKSISYSQAMYILAENKGKPALECINESKAMMDGHKADYFVLNLSFLGWAILGSFTLGILYIWLMPYMNATYINFYNAIKGVPAAPAVEVPVAEAPAAEAPAEEPAEETVAE